MSKIRSPTTLESKLDDIVKTANVAKQNIYVELKSGIFHSENAVFLIIPLGIIFLLLLFEPWFVMTSGEDGKEKRLSLYYFLKWSIFFILVCILALWWYKRKSTTKSIR